ncbi:MAG: hypothetical protein K2Q17_07415 [Nitrospiraceae bacterium]|nr:hypothetical protein [Nitrospiraceae bacterium]
MEINDPPNRIVSIILDGENAWGAYPQQARPFLHVLYTALVADPEIRTVTFREYLEANPTRRVPAYPLTALPRVYDPFEASWRAGSTRTVRGPGTISAPGSASPRKIEPWTCWGKRVISWTM